MRVRRACDVPEGGVRFLRCFRARTLSRTMSAGGADTLGPWLKATPARARWRNARARGRSDDRRLRATSAATGCQECVPGGVPPFVAGEAVGAAAAAADVDADAAGFFRGSSRFVPASFPPATVASFFCAFFAALTCRVVGWPTAGLVEG